MTLPPYALPEYETLPLPSLTPQQLDEVVRTHGLTLDGPIAPMESSGVVHTLWSLGTQWVLRLPKKETMCLGDHYCEAIAIPMARQAGVRTPALVVIDDSQTITDVPYSIVDRVHGTDLGSAPRDHPAYELAGEQLARLHHTTESLVEHPQLRIPGEPVAEAFFDDVIAAGVLHRDGVAWCRELGDRLDLIIDAGPPAPRAFVHGDVKPDNLMVDVAGAVHVIDWGGAGFGDPAYDFQSLPLAATELVLDGYRRVTDTDPTLEARVVRRVLARSLANLRRTPLGGPSWYRPIAANIVDLLTFAADRPETWRRWTTP